MARWVKYAKQVEILFDRAIYFGRHFVKWW